MAEIFIKFFEGTDVLDGLDETYGSILVVEDRGHRGPDRNQLTVAVDQIAFVKKRFFQGFQFEGGTLLNAGFAANDMKTGKTPGLFPGQADNGFQGVVDKDHAAMKVKKGDSKGDVIE